ncbi:MAG: substrate-binding domain-containing protein [Phycisphaerae bacterium]
MGCNSSTFQAARRVRRGVKWGYVLFLPLFAGCGGAEDAKRLGRLPTSGTLVTVIGPSQDDPAWPATRGGIRRFAEHAEYLRIETMTPSARNVAEKRALFEQELGRKPAAIVLFVTDADVDRRLAERAAEESVLLVTVGARLNGVRPFAHVEPDLPALAERLAERLPDIAGEQRTYALIHDRGANEMATRCHDHFMRVARLKTSLVQLAECNAFESNRIADDVIAEFCGRFRHLGLIVLLGATDTPRAASAIGAGQTRLVVLSATPDHWGLLESGKAAALAGPLDGELGYTLARVTAEGLNGDVRPGRTHPVPCEIVTPAELPGFEQRYAEAAGMELSVLLESVRGK